MNAELSDGRIVAGRLVGTAPRALRFVSADQRSELELKALRRLVWSNPPAYLPTRGGARRLWLFGREDYPAGEAALDEGAIVCRPLGGDLVRIPVGAVRGLVQCSSTFELQLATADGDADQPLGGPGETQLAVGADQAWSGKHSFAVPSRASATILRSRRTSPAGGVTLMFYDLTRFDPEESWSLVFQFGDDPASRMLNVELGGPGKEVVAQTIGEWRLETRDIPRRQGWRALRLIVDERRMAVLIDEQVVATGVAPAGRFVGLRVAGSAVSQGAQQKDKKQGTPKGKQPVAWLDDLTEFASRERFDVPRTPADVDTLWTSAGDEVFVAVFDSGEKPKSLPGNWRDLRGVLPGRRDCPASRRVSGQMLRVTLVPRIGEATEPGGTIEAALQSADEGGLVLDHPWLGRLVVPTELVHSATPSYHGTLKVLDPQPHHLGNNDRPDWLVPLPSGTERVWEFQIVEELDNRGTEFLGLTVVDLEPFGTAMARTGPQADELSRGGLLTQVWVNSRQIGDLNSLLSQPATRRHPQKLRIRLPGGLLRKGVNTLRLVQLPSLRDPAEFDDCEISDLTLEVHEDQPD